MSQKICKLIAILILFQVISSQLSLDQTTDATVSILSSDNDGYRYFLKRAITSTSQFSFVSARLNQQGTAFTKFKYDSTVDLTLKAISKDYSCAILHDSASSTKRLLVVDFTTGDGIQKEDLILSTLIAEADIAGKTFQVGDSCNALKINDIVYHFKAAGSPSKYVADIVPSGWAKVTFSDDFMWAVGNAGIYKYNSADSANLKYDVSLATNFNDNKKIYGGSNGIVVMDWIVSATTNVNNYTIKAYKYSTTFIATLVGTISGQYHTTDATKPPIVSIDDSQRTIVVYGKTPADATKFFAQGASIDFSANTVTEFTIPAWITDTESVISVSDQYLYARNIVDDTTLTPPAMRAGSYFVANSVLTEYKAPATLVAADITTADWKRTKVYSAQNGHMKLLIESISSTNVITINTLVVPVPTALQFFIWDKKDNVDARLVSGAGTQQKSHQTKLQWFLVSKQTGVNYYFQSIRTDPANALAMEKSTYAVNQNYVLKAVSANFKCALIYESAGPSLKVVNFDSAPTATTYATVTASLYSGITLTDPLTTFDVADNCRAFRINNKVFHYYSDNAYHLDTYPDGTTSLSNPTFNQDFSLAIADNGIYKYSQKTVDTAGIYNVDRADTFVGEKQIWKDGDKYIIAMHQIINNTHFDWKVQVNIIQNDTSIKIDEFKGIVQNMKANVRVSPKLTKIIIQGLVGTNTTAYVAKTIDWLNKNTKDITLPTVITGGFESFVLSDDFIFMMNFQEKRNLAWAIMGSICTQAYDQPYKYPMLGYMKSFILPDESGNKKLILAHQYLNGDFVRLFKDERMTVSQVINPNPVSNSQLTLSSIVGPSLVYSKYPYFGKWMYTTVTGTTLNYVQYKSNQTNKKRIVTKTGLTGDNVIKATSLDFDCALTSVSGSDLMTIKINSDSTTPTLSAWASIVTSGDMTAANVATALSAGKVGVGAGCWAVRVGDLVFYKNAAGTAFTKSAIIATLTTPVFDSSLTFAYAGGKVYQYTTTDYVEIFQVAGLKSTVQLFASQDKKKVILLSYEPTAVGPSTYVTVLKAYHFGTAWNPITLPSVMSSFTTVSGIPTAITELTMETFGVWYNIQDGSSIKPLIYLAKADYVAGTVSLYEIPSQWTVTQADPYFSIFGNYLYVYRVIDNPAGNSFTEMLYKIDKANTKIILISTRQLSQNEAIEKKNEKIFEESGNIYALYEYHSGSDVKLVKRLIGSQAVQQTIRGIEVKDAGLLVKDGQVFICPPGCSYCLNTNSCETCLPGFVLDSNKNCLRCGQLCLSCAATTLNTCIGCVNGYYFDGSICKQCNDNCLTCGTSATDCLTCKVGFYPSSNTCLPCIDNCVSCNPSVPTDPLCSTCRKGYVYNTATKSCVKCVAGCANCNPDKVYQCLKCGDGYDSSIVNNTLVCTKCPDNCVTCLGQTCQVCRNGFRLVNNTCIAQCKLPCKECLATDAAKCTSCVGGYTLNGESCNQDLSCNSAKTCTTCPLGYNLIAGVCYQCNGGANCRTCDNTNLAVCASCNKGYYLTSTATCAACKITGCVACNTDVFCQQCKPGYVLSGSANSGKCLRCDDSCATCFDSPSNCETCAQGYTKKGWNCINKNNIKVQLKVNTNFATFSTVDYEAIQQDIADRIGKDRKHINVEQIKTGSVIMVLTINNNNVAQQTTLMSNLQTSLAVGTSIGGFPIETSSLTAVSADPITPVTPVDPVDPVTPTDPQNVYISDDAQAKRYRDIAIIVGVVIPVGLIIIFAVLFVLYKKGIIFANSATIKVHDNTMSDAHLNHKESSINQMRKS